MRQSIEKAAQGVRDIRQFLKVKSTLCFYLYAMKYQGLGSMLYCIKTGMLVPNPARHCGGKKGEHCSIQEQPGSRFH